MKYLVLVLGLLSLACCSSPHKLATCKGPLIALNTDRWQPSETDMHRFEQLCPEDR